MAFKIVPNYPHLPFLIETATDFSAKSDEFTRSSVSKIIKELSEMPSYELSNPFKKLTTKADAPEESENFAAAEESKFAVSDRNAMLPL